MIKINHLIFLVFISLLILYPAPSYSLDVESNSAQKEFPVEIDADSITFDQENGIYVAEGNVVASQAGVTLRADRVVIDMENGRLVATGNLTGSDEGGNELKGDSIELDLDLKSAVFINGTLFFKKNNIYIKSDEIRKTGPQTYEAGYTTFTSCDCDYEAGEKPAWSISTRSSNITIGKYFTGWHSVFRVKSLPLFYLPYVKFPIKMDRQTGFLMPSPGYSDVRGATLSNPFFWAISPTTDSTLTLDLDSKRGTGVGLEFRHYSSRLSYSELHLYYYSEDDIDRVRRFRENVDNLSRPLSADADRWELRFSHDEMLPHTLKLRADVNIVSDEEYLIDFEDDKDRRSVASLESTISLTKDWKLHSLVIEFRRFDSLLDENDDDVLQKIPEITFTALPRRILDTPFYISFDLSAVNYIRRVGTEGQRVDIASKLSMPLRPGGLFEFTPSITPRYTKYRVIGPTDVSYPDRAIYEFRTDVVTTLVKEFPASGDKEARAPMRHTIRPRFAYVFVPDVDQQGIPSFDEIDAIAATNKLEYSINTTLNRRYTEGGKLKRREYLYFNLANAYDIRETQRSLASAFDKREPFDDLKAELRLRPVKAISLVAQGEFDLYDKVFNRYDATLILADNRGDSFYITYRSERSLQTLYMEGGAKLYFHRTLDLTLKQRYSFDLERSLETRADLEFRQQCWGATLTYQRTPEEEKLLLNFTLENFGRLVGLSEVM